MKESDYILAGDIARLRVVSHILRGCYCRDDIRDALIRVEDVLDGMWREREDRGVLPEDGEAGRR